MKTLILLLLLLTAPLYAAQSIVLAWDANPAAEAVTSYNVYERVAGSWVKIGATSATTITLPDVQPGAHVYAVTALNLRESERSTEVTLPAVPGSPRNVRVIVEVQVP